MKQRFSIRFTSILLTAMLIGSFASAAGVTVEQDENGYVRTATLVNPFTGDIWITTWDSGPGTFNRVENDRAGWAHRVSGGRAEMAFLSGATMQVIYVGSGSLILSGSCDYTPGESNCPFDLKRLVMHGTAKATDADGNKYQIRAQVQSKDGVFTQFIMEIIPK